MKETEKLVSDAERVAYLRSLGILDTPPEERFDRLTRMARRIFDVPISVVSLVDTARVWHKSCTGLHVKETPRELSFCARAMLDDRIMVIPDARLDDRFSDNPAVTADPLVRFYAGCPLRSRNGLKLGTFCILDNKPRDLTSDEEEIMLDMTSMVQSELQALEAATTDDLTQITNRRGFLLLAQQSMRVFARHYIPATLVFLDLTRFKEINDQFGHAEGDLVLKVFAEKMRETFRESDLFARIGGDEFVVLFTNTRKQVAANIVKKFVQSLTLYNENSGKDYEVQFAFGAVQYDPLKHQTVEDLLCDGDSLMYTHKRRAGSAFFNRKL